MGAVEGEEGLRVHEVLRYRARQQMRAVPGQMRVAR